MACLDSSFVIDLLRNHPSIKKIMAELDDSDEIIFMPAPALTEIVSGIDIHKKEREIMAINTFLSKVTLLELDKESAWLAGEIESELRRKGELIDIVDIMIGAIALQNKEALVTKNKKHFERIKGLDLISY